MRDRVLFYGVGAEYGEFSNFARYPIRLDGKKWPTSTTSRHRSAAIPRFVNASGRQALLQKRRFSSLTRSTPRKAWGSISMS